MISSSIKRNFVRQIIRNWLLSHPNLNPYLWKEDPGIGKFFSGFFRIDPSFIIIGAQKCGTTSLYDYLIQHPNIEPAYRKEIHFFDMFYHMGFHWYKAHYPMGIKNYFKSKNKKIISGEATPDYIIHPEVPKMIFSKYPKIKNIVILRNPVDRAFSHYQMQVRKGFEFRPFDESIKVEEAIINKKNGNLIEEEKYDYDFSMFSYLRRGIYVDQIEYWLKFFSKNQILILDTNDLNNQTQNVLTSIFEFLELKNYDIKDFSRKNIGKYSDMNPTMREYLIDFFKPHNKKLYDLLGRRFDWDR